MKIFVLIPSEKTFVSCFSWFFEPSVDKLVQNQGNQFAYIVEFEGWIFLDKCSIELQIFLHNWLVLLRKWKKLDELIKCNLRLGFGPKFNKITQDLLQSLISFLP